METVNRELRGGVLGRARVTEGSRVEGPVLEGEGFTPRLPRGYPEATVPLEILRGCLERCMHALSP